MSKLVYYFNNNFKSGYANDEYYGVFVVDDENGSCFGIKLKKIDGKINRFSLPKYEYGKHIRGYAKGNHCFMYEEFDDMFVKFDDKEIAAMETCMSNLIKAFRYHIMKMKADGTSYHKDRQAEIYSEIMDIKKEFLERKNKRSKGMTEVVQYKEITDLEVDKINLIVESVFENEGKEVEVGGKIYCLKIESGVPQIFEVIKTGKTVSAETDVVEETSVKIEKGASPKVYKTKTMAFCIEDGMPNIVKNNLYEIIGESGKYLLVKDCDEKLVYVNRKRFTEIEVFVEDEAIETIGSEA